MNTISLSPELQQFIQLELDAGGYASPDEVLLEAMKLLRKRSALDAEIQKGVDQLARGEYIEYDKQAWKKKFDDIRAQILAKGGALHE